MVEKVFLCGTDDVKWVMESLDENLPEFGFKPIWFHKTFKVEDKDTMETCIENVRDGDRLILVVNKRYGLPFRYTRENGKISISEEEFLTAVDEEKKMLIFIENSVLEQSKIYRKLIENSDLEITEENKESYGFKAQLETYEFIDRIQHMKKDGILDVRWIEPFRDIREILEQIKFKWIYEQKEIIITFMDDSIEYNIPQQQIKLYSEEEIKKKKEEIKSEYSYEPTKESEQKKQIKELVEKFPFPRVKKISEEDWQIYNECVELYSEKYGKYLIALNEYNQKISEYCSLGFNLHNFTHFALYDITAYINFPEGLEIQNKSLEDPPEEPKPLPKPKDLAMLSNGLTYDLGKEIRKYKEDLIKIPSTFSGILTGLMPDIDISSLIDSPFKILNKGRLRINIDKLTQQHYFKIPEYELQIINKEENKKFKISWEIYVSNPSQTLEGELCVNIEQENEV
ncbi:hypothetical protein ES705_21180 [subsurface metagenome]